MEYSSSSLTFVHRGEPGTPRNHLARRRRYHNGQNEPFEKGRGAHVSIGSQAALGSAFSPWSAHLRKAEIAALRATVSSGHTSRHTQGDGTVVCLSASGAVLHDVTHQVVHVVLQIPDDVLDNISDRNDARDPARVQHWEVAKTPRSHNRHAGV